MFPTSLTVAPLVNAKACFISSSPVKLSLWKAVQDLNVSLLSVMGPFLFFVLFCFFLLVSTAKVSMPNAEVVRERSYLAAFLLLKVGAEFQAWSGFSEQTEQSVSVLYHALTACYLCD